MVRQQILTETKNNQFSYIAVESLIIELEDQFGMLVQDVEELLRVSVKISELPNIIRYKLPQRLRGIRDHVRYDSITEEQFPEFFKNLEEM